MKFTAETNELIARLNILAKAQKKSLNGQLASIKLFLKDKVLYMYANDGEVDVKTNMVVETEDETDCIVVNAEQFTSMINSVPNQTITFTSNDNYNIVIKYNNHGKYKMQGFAVSEYIDIDFKGERGEKISVNRNTLLEALEKAKTCVCKKDLLRPIFMGIHIEFTSEGLLVVSTDTRSLMFCQEPNSGIAKNDYIINIPLKTALLLTTILNQCKNESTVDFYGKENSVEIIVGEYNVESVLIDGKYPPYKNVIPQDNNIALHVNRKSFISALKRVCNFSQNVSHLVKITSVKDNCYYVSTENLDFSLSASETVETEKPSVDMTVGMDSEILLNILSAFNDEEITLLLNENNTKPLLIKSDVGVHTECVIMPLML